VRRGVCHWQFSVVSQACGQLHENGVAVLRQSNLVKFAVNLYEHQGKAYVSGSHNRASG
jgi:hypothetical protein